MELSIIEYPALVYQGNRNNVFIANCIMKNIVGYGHSVEDAIENLEKALNDLNSEYIAKVKPIQGLQLSQG